jgi:hypothetical protein
MIQQMSENEKGTLTGSFFYGLGLRGFYAMSRITGASLLPSSASSLPFSLSSSWPVLS